VDALDAVHDAATPATGAPAAAHSTNSIYVTPAPAARRPACMHDDAMDAPAPRVRGGRARAVDAATAAALCGLGAVESPGVSEYAYVY
jgi:hypothetical protein